MKNTLLQIVMVLAACFGAPAGFRTANASEEADNSMLGLAIKAAGVDPEDVRWRIAAGLDKEQAIQAAIAQKEADAATKKAEQKAKAEQKEAKGAKDNTGADGSKKENK